MMNKRILIAVVILILIGGVIWFAQNKSADNKNLKTRIEVNNSAEQEAAYNKAIAEDSSRLSQDLPKDVQQRVYLDRAVAQYGLGNLAEAKADFDAAARIDANNPAVWAGLYPVLRDMGDMDGAENALKKVVTLNPLDWNMWRAYIEFEQYTKHISNEELDKIYKQAMEATHTDINIVTVYAQFLEQTKGDKQSALNYWKIALEQQPTNKLYQTEVARLKKELGQK